MCPRPWKIWPFLLPSNSDSEEIACIETCILLLNRWLRPLGLSAWITGAKLKEGRHAWPVGSDSCLASKRTALKGPKRERWVVLPPAPQRVHACQGEARSQGSGGIREFQNRPKGAVRPRHAERGMKSDPSNLMSRTNEMMGLFRTMDLSRK